MKHKLEKFTFKQIKLDFVPTEDWLKTRKLVKESKCENCGKKHAECDGEIALATIEGRLNAHLCKSCGQYYIDRGAVDINKNIAKGEVLKEKLVKQAERIGHKFNTYWNKKEGKDYSVAELKTIIIKRIDAERKCFRNMLRYTHLEILKEFVDAYNEATPRYKVTYLTVFKDPHDFLCDYDSDDNYDHRKWYSYFDATLKLGDKTFSYGWANVNGDNDLENAGFDVHSVWETMTVSTPPKPLSQEEMLAEYEKCRDNPHYFITTYLRTFRNGAKEPVKISLSESAFNEKYKHLINNYENTILSKSIVYPEES